MPEDVGVTSTDLTKRFDSLREVVRNDVNAAIALADARMDGIDSGRNAALATLASERGALIDRIQGVRVTAHAENEALEAQVNRRLEAMQLQMDQRLGSQRESYSELKAMLDERYATQTKALDAAFIAQQTAMRTAFDAADRAVAAALESAEKAVAKAEVASDKRFESVNEFRQQLADQTANFPTRNEINVRMDAMQSGVDRNAAQLNSLELRLTSRLDTASGRASGSTEHKSEQRLDTAQILQLLALLVLAAGVIVSIIITRG